MNLAEVVKVAFASEFSFYLKAHNFHWNVEGPGFFQFHELFGKVYEEVYGSIDDFAEKIRAIGSYMPGSYTRFSHLSEIADEVDILSAEQMLHTLYQDNEQMLVILKMAYDFAEQAGEHGLSNFLAERMDAHRKHGWMLRASMK